MTKIKKTKLRKTADALHAKFLRLDAAANSTEGRTLEEIEAAWAAAHAAREAAGAARLEADNADLAEQTAAEAETVRAEDA